MDCHNFCFSLPSKCISSYFSSLSSACRTNISELQNQNANLDRNLDFTMERLEGKQEALWLCKQAWLKFRTGWWYCLMTTRYPGDLIPFSSLSPLLLDGGQIISLSVPQCPYLLIDIKRNGWWWWNKKKKVVQKIEKVYLITFFQKYIDNPDDLGRMMITIMMNAVQSPKLSQWVEETPLISDPHSQYF